MTIIKLPGLREKLGLPPTANADQIVEAVSKVQRERALAEARKVRSARRPKEDAAYAALYGAGESSGSERDDPAYVAMYPSGSVS